MALNPVQKWLHSILGPYRHAQQVYADVDRTLHAVPSLSPRTETYTYDDGRTVLLLTLQGTLPISFRNSTYNIPVAYWLPHEYPQQAPIAYVVPTASMLVRPSKNVELSGRVTADLLEQWARKAEGNNLLLLTETLQSIFSREPPLYAKPAQTNGSTPVAGPSTSASPGPAMRPPPPAPASLTQSPGPPNRQHSPSPSAQQNGQAPVRPQKPWLTGAQDSQLQHGQHARSVSASASASNYRASPAPQYSGAANSQPGQEQAPYRPPMPPEIQHRRASSHQSTPQHGQLQPPLQQQQPRYQQHSMQPHGLPSQHPTDPSIVHTPQHGGYPAPQHSHYSNPTSPVNAPLRKSLSPQQSMHAESASGQISRQRYNQPQPPHIFASPQASASETHAKEQPPPIVPPRPDSFRRHTPSSVANSSKQPPRMFTTPINILDDDDEPPGPSGAGPGSARAPPPPRPVNPELLNLRRALYSQLTHHMHSLQAHLNDENGHLQALHDDLLKGEPAILDEMQRLEAVRDVCASVRDRMSEVVQNAERNVDDLATRRETEVDELVCGTNVVHNQLLELVAEDNAIEDTIYHLGRSFNSDTRSQQDLERFLKRTRILARDLFMKRSLINKILLEIALSRAQRD